MQVTVKWMKNNAEQQGADTDSSVDESGKLISRLPISNPVEGAYECVTKSTRYTTSPEFSTTVKLFVLS